MTGVAPEEADVVLRDGLTPPGVVGGLEYTCAAVINNLNDAAEVVGAYIVIPVALAAALHAEGVALAVVEMS